VLLGAGVVMGQFVFQPAGTGGAGTRAGGITWTTAGTTTANATTMLRVATLPASTRKSVVVKSMPFVETAPIVVTMKLLDPEHGYRPKHYNGEGGSCETKYSSHFGFDAAPPTVKKAEDGSFVATLACQAPHAKVTAAFDLWLPARSPEWLTDHEETHRAISERTYAEGVPQISALLTRMNFKTYTVHAATEALAMRAAREAPTKEFDEAYARLMPAREMRLNDEFDRITRHGLETGRSNHEIMEDLFAEDAKAGGPATTTTRPKP
jgi:hypothetical protein